eukprot:TRINITY_DN6819_c0_g1_i1.p1 TRINITY_DN6819_c0_g1~~TRINITY_DN6819_c0_g1_i1.p1  ORF type:complete len:590 (+),score=112.12 TRINITY_DN6819_c0_g1_i1:107-1876(+)
MRICNGLTGEALDLDDRELPWKKLLDLVKQQACERWSVPAEELIVLAGDGSLVGPDWRAEEFDKGQYSCSSNDIFVFVRNALSGFAPDPVSDQLAFVEDEIEDHDSSHPEDELLRLRAECGDSAVEQFRSNIAEARRRVVELRPIASLVTREEARLQVQRLAGRAVLENLASHVATCTRSLTLFLQKHERVQERLDNCLAQVEPSMAALGATTLHHALRAPGQETLADVVPRERILRFTAKMQAERDRLGQRMEKLRHRHEHVQVLCDQVAERLRQLSDENGVDVAARAIAAGRSKAESELLPALCACVPREGADAHAVLADEQQSEAILKSLTETCLSVRNSQADLAVASERSRGALLQRLREVSYMQSKVREVERQAALLEEEINSQRGSTQQLNHIKRMPKAYQRMLFEIARRREFRTRYATKIEMTRTMLAKMMEDENAHRREFIQRYGCHLPAELIQGLGSFVPPTSVHVPEFDVALPEIDFASLLDSTAGALALPHDGVGGVSKPSSCSSSLRSREKQRGHVAPSAGAGASASAHLASAGSVALAVGGGCFDDATKKIVDLEERNRALEEQVASLTKAKVDSP